MWVFLGGGVHEIDTPDFEQSLVRHNNVGDVEKAYLAQVIL